MFCPCVKFNQFVFARTQPQLFRVLERGLPIGVRMDGMEVVVRVMDVVTLVFVTQQACRIDRCGVDRIRTCLIERDRVKGCKHADIRHDSHVVFRVAVAVGRHIDNQRNVEARTAVHDCFGVFRDFAVENDVGFIISASNRVGRAYADAAAAADALIVVDMCFFVRDGDGAVCADTCAHAAADARVLSTCGLPALCCSILPAREPQPMPMFFRQPPKPLASWPLKWVREINTSASMMACPILASLTYSPPSTGTYASSVPFRPSAMMTWQPVENGEKPLR